MNRYLALMTAALIVATCSGGSASPEPSAAPGSPSATPVATPPTPSALPSASPEPRWLLVTISDSTLGIGQGDVAAADAYADWIERDLGVAVTVRSFFYGGSTSGQILLEVQTRTSLREALADADVILLDVPVGELKELCPWDDVSYAPGPGTPAEYAACGAEMATSYEADADAIMDEIVALRSPAHALIRTTELWKPFYPTFESMGLGAVTHQNLLAIWAGLGRAAAAHSIPVAPAYAAFVGSDGRTDPVAAGEVGADELHLTARGAAKLALLLRELGYDTAGR